VQVTDPATGQIGSVRDVVLDIRRSGVQLEGDVGSVQMLAGTWSVIVMSGLDAGHAVAVRDDYIRNITYY